MPEDPRDIQLSSGKRSAAEVTSVVEEESSDKTWVQTVATTNKRIIFGISRNF
jgi:hypothetical protein